MFTKKRIKKILIGIGITLLVLWFGGNLATYLYLRQVIIKPQNIEHINTVPEKLQLREANIEAEWLPFKDVKLKFPYYKEDINHVIPAFFNHHLSGIIVSMKKGSVRYVGYYEFALPTPTGEQNRTFLSDIREGHYSRLRDFSWWNLIHNIRLSAFLIAKAMTISVVPKHYQIYDVETPHFTGFLTEHHPKEDILLVDFITEMNSEHANLTFSGKNEMLNQTKDIIASIQPLADIDESYKTIEASYKQKKSKYPEELLLLSMISLKGATVENLQELLRIMKKKNYKPDYMKEVEAEINFLSNQGKKP